MATYCFFKDGIENSLSRKREHFDSSSRIQYREKSGPSRKHEQKRSELDLISNTIFKPYYHISISLRHKEIITKNNH
jgi:hypothetical protein